jgi:protein PET100, fungi type
MGGPGLEIFKFSLYLFVPIAALVHFGSPEWYRTYVIPVRPLIMWLTPSLNV